MRIRGFGGLNKQTHTHTHTHTHTDKLTDIQCSKG